MANVLPITGGARTDAATRLTVLESDWTGLSPHLIGTIWPVNYDGTDAPNGVMVRAPVTESTYEATLNWTSPFESSGPDSKAPALTALLQSGNLQPLMNEVKTDLNAITGKQIFDLNAATSKTNAFVKQFEGRTGITKLNSTQIFTGMPPIKLPVQMLFRAFRDAKAEVEDPYAQLLRWALPRNLSEDGVLVNISQEVRSQGSGSRLSALLPSEAPQLVGFSLGRLRIAPVVIEAIARPLSGPVTKDGYRASMVVTMTLCSLKAVDANDVATTFR